MTINHPNTPFAPVINFLGFTLTLWHQFFVTNDKQIYTMIKANELRIGNMLLWNPKLSNPKTTLLAELIEVTAILEDRIGYLSPRVEHRVEPFEDDVLELDAPHRPLEEFEPVGLTAEILEKCGFVADTTNHVGAYRKEPLNVVVNDNTVLVASDNREFGYKYLHQLQNLYFTLKGEELKINWD